MKIPKGKRAATGVLATLFEFYQLIWPDLLSDQWETRIYWLIAALGTLGIGDWFNRKYITKTPYK